MARQLACLCVVASAAASVAVVPRAPGESPYAAAVESYAPGVGAVPGYTNPLVALGPPERFTGEGLVPQAVTPFQPPFLSSEIVSLGMGGSLVLSFDHDVLDDPANPFGIDLILFANSFATDASFPQGTIGGLWSEGGTVWLSPDGVRWTLVPGLDADGPLPTLGYVDVGPYATSPGRIPTDFTRPVDPQFDATAILGFTYDMLVSAYGGSGGGAGIDLAPLGLDRVRYVRVDGNLAFGMSPEIDAVADVAPRPALPGDLDGDGEVGGADLASLLGSWGTSGPGDLDGNGTVDGADLSILLGSWS